MGEKEKINNISDCYYSDNRIQYFCYGGFDYGVFNSNRTFKEMEYFY